VHTGLVPFPVMRPGKAFATGLKIHHYEIRIEFCTTWPYLALEWLVSRVSSYMCIQLLLGEESLWASLALVISLQLMSPLSVINER
jgi:hypothetical protein